MKEAEAQYVTPSVPSLNNSGLQALVTIEKNGTEVRLGQEASLVPTPQTQGEAQQEKSKDNKPEELKVTIAPKEQILILTLVIIPLFVTPPNSQAL